MRVVVAITGASGSIYARLTIEALLRSSQVEHIALVYSDTAREVIAFEGVVMGRRGSGISETFTVRRVSFGIGVERTFLVNSPKVEKVEVVRHGKVRRAKLYYLRDRVGKATKVKEKITLKEESAE